MLRKVFGAFPEENQEEQGTYFFHEELDPKEMKLTTEDLDTLDEWDGLEETAGNA